MEGIGTSEHIIQDVAGCGLFQVVLSISVLFISKLPVISSMVFMSFGNYNPGYRCHDDVNISVIDNNESSRLKLGDIEEQYTKDNCSVFDSCSNIEFSSDASTIVTELGLVCQKAWVSSFIISLQMAGLFIGCSLAGYLGDAFGRKITICVSVAVLAVLNCVSVFATSWEVFAFLRTLIGVANGCFNTFDYVYVLEFVTIRWRGPVSCIPTTPAIGVVFALFSLAFKDWRYLHIVNCVISVIGLMTLIWMPESLRWLEVKKKKKTMKDAALKILRLNGKTSFPLEEINTSIDIDIEEKSNRTSYSYLDLFRKRNLKSTIFIALPWLTSGMIFYAITFGVKALSGDFYINLIIVAGINIPFSIFPILAPNIIGRRLSSILSAAGTGLFLLGAAFFQYASGEIGTTGSLVMAVLGKMVLFGLWTILTVYTMEIYPTVIRGRGASWGNMMGRVGGILAPFLIPDTDDGFFVCYIIMGVLAFLCCLSIMALPETKDRVLEETLSKERETTDELCGEEAETDQV